MGEFQREKQVQVQSEKVREKPAEAKETVFGKSMESI